LYRFGKPGKIVLTPKTDFAVWMFKLKTLETSNNASHFISRENVLKGMIMKITDSSLTIEINAA
jgi:hypothetical protein